jgi:hypothetical protein
MAAQVGIDPVKDIHWVTGRPATRWRFSRKGCCRWSAHRVRFSGINVSGVRAAPDGPEIPVPGDRACRLVLCNPVPTETAPTTEFRAT